MRLTREYVFDMVEMVGRAIATAARKGEHPLPGDLAAVVPAYKDAFLLPWEKRSRDHSLEWFRYVAQELRAIDRGLRFRDITLLEAMKDLHELALRMKPFLSQGWANQLRRLIDLFSP
jgi:hypothetical protein